MWGGEEQQGVRGKREPLNQQYTWKMWEIFWAPGVFGWANVLLEQDIFVVKPDNLLKVQHEGKL